MKLTNQQRKVANYIFAHRGCTTKDIMLGTGIQCPSARITEIRQAGINIYSIGKKRYPGAQPFEMYAIDGPKETVSPERIAAQPTDRATKQLAITL